MKRRATRRGSRSKPSARRPTRPPRRPATAAVHLTAAEELVALRAAWDRSARRWRLLWQIVVEFLEREAPEVHEWLHRRLAHYELATPFAQLVEPPGSLPVLEWMVAPALLSPTPPPPQTIHRLEAMAADTTRVERRGRKTETPLWHALIFYECARERARRDPTVLRCKETREHYAIRSLSTRLGDREPDSWRKLLRQARQYPGLEDLARRIALARDSAGVAIAELIGEF
jgi:hypothetical protein